MHGTFQVPATNSLKSLDVISVHIQLDRLSLRISACPTRLYRVGTLRVLSMKCCHLAGPQKCTFSAAVPTLRNKVGAAGPLGDPAAPTHLIFPESIKTWLFTHGLGNSDGSVVHCWGIPRGSFRHQFLGFVIWFYVVVIVIVAVSYRELCSKAGGHPVSLTI